MPLTHIFFDVGGVLATNGWDSNSRAEAREVFAVEDSAEERHDAIVEEWESGNLTLDQYLDAVWFDRPRDFSREEFFEFMKAQSVPDEDAIDVVRTLRETCALPCYTLNDESEALNLYRIRHFGIEALFDGFLSSCWLGSTKPRVEVYHRALGIVQAAPEEVLFLDDREVNVETALEIGMNGELTRSAEAITDVLRKHGMLDGQ